MQNFCQSTKSFIYIYRNIVDGVIYYMCYVGMFNKTTPWMHQHVHFNIYRSYFMYTNTMHVCTTIHRCNVCLVQLLYTLQTLFTIVGFPYQSKSNLNFFQQSHLFYALAYRLIFYPPCQFMYFIGSCMFAHIYILWKALCMYMGF